MAGKAFTVNGSHLEMFEVLGTLETFWDYSQLYCSSRISLMENPGCFPPGKASCDRVALPNLRCMLGVLVFP